MGQIAEFPGFNLMSCWQGHLTVVFIAELFLEREKGILGKILLYFGFRPRIRLWSRRR